MSVCGVLSQTIQWGKQLLWRHAELRSCSESLSQTLNVRLSVCCAAFCGVSLRRIDFKVITVSCSSNFISFNEISLAHNNTKSFSQRVFFPPQILVRPVVTTPALRGRVCLVRWAPSSQCGARPRAGPVPPTPPRTRWAPRPPPRVSTRPVFTTRGRGWPSSRAPTTRPRCLCWPRATGGWSPGPGSASSWSSPASLCPRAAPTPWLWGGGPGQCSPPARQLTVHCWWPHRWTE